MNLLDGGDVIVGFRPEALLPAIVVPAPSVAFRFRVTHVEYLGSERILYGVVEGGRFDGKKAVSRVAASAGASYAEGTSHDFAVRVGELKFFDHATEKRAAPREFAWR